MCEVLPGQVGPGGQSSATGGSAKCQNRSGRRNVSELWNVNERWPESIRYSLTAETNRWYFIQVQVNFTLNDPLGI